MSTITITTTTSSTDISAYTLPFVKHNVSTTAFLGMPSLTWKFWKPLRQLTAIAHYARSMEKHRVNLHDARVHTTTYAQSGFHLDSVSPMTDWDSEEQLDAFKAEVEAIVMKLHPQTKRIEWSGGDFLKRGGEGNNPPALDNIHLDYYQDPKQVADFTGREEVQADVILGVWRPCEMTNPVLDYPLVCMDASTFKPDDQVRQEQEFQHITPRGVEDVINLAAMVHHNPEQKWYYYNEVTPSEVILFTHYTKAKFFANPHCAVKQQDLPEGKQTRKSLEQRISLFF